MEPQLLAIITISLLSLGGLILLGVRNQYDLEEKLADVKFRSESSLNLGVFRVVLCATILLSVRPRRLLQYSRLPSDILVSPWDINLLKNVFVLDPTVTMGVLGVFYVTGVLALIGWQTRYALSGFLLASLYVLTIPQLFGTVHYYHHLIWFLIILVSSPSGDSLSLDAYLGEDGSFLDTTTSLRYTLPLTFCWLIIGFVYFFPGIWKLWESGSSWVLGQHFKLTLYHQWYHAELMPFFRIDQYPILYRTLSSLLLLFELGFIIAVFNRYSRLVALGLGIIFHLLGFHLLFWTFVTLPFCYVVFFDFKPLVEKETWEEKLLGWGRLSKDSATDRLSLPTLETDRTIQSTLIVGTTLLAIILATGFTHAQSGWPFTCYPTFAEQPEPTVWSLQFNVYGEGGVTAVYEEDVRRHLNYPDDEPVGPIRDLLHGETYPSFERKSRTILKHLNHDALQTDQDVFVKIYSVERHVLPGKRETILKRNPVTSVTVER